MKIGIITFWDSRDNYGQQLQCYALQQYLRNQGHDALVIRYIHKNTRQFSLSKFSPQHIVSFIRYRLGKTDSNENVLRDFDSFRKNICFSDKIYNGFIDLVSEDWSSFDAFICGSDQIWSPKSDDELKSYFLKFTPFQKLRIAYAPSFGRLSLDEKYQKELSHLLAGFDAISVREDSGTAIVKEAGYEAELVCDPTFLLGAADYSKTFVSEATCDKHAFLYFINWETDADYNSINRYLESNSFSVRLFSTHGFESPWSLYQKQSPQEWLSSLSSARISVINSFHGLVFSIIFHVPFAVCLLKGAQQQMNGRIISLLTKLGLTSRIITETRSVESIFEEDINWQDVDNRLSGFIESSKKYLEQSLNISTGKKERYNICFLTNGGVHHRYGGLDRVTEILADKFESDGHNVCYLSWKNRGTYNPDRQSFLPDSGVLNSDENLEFISRFVEQRNIDFIINQEGNVNFCLPFKGRDKVRIISCLHFSPDYIDDKHFYYRLSSAPSVIKYVGRALLAIPFVNNAGLRHLRKKLSENYQANLEYCDRYVLLSSRFQKSLCELACQSADIEKIEYINNPNVKSHDSVDINKKEKIILFVGRLDNNFKRIDSLIDIAGRVLAHNPDWRFILCGDGPDRDMLVRQARKISDRIIFAGYCDPTEYYRKASVIIMRSSKSEGWGMVLVEAMSQGVVPVVSGTYDSLPDIITDGVDGMITDSCSSSFENALSTVVSNSRLREEMAQNTIVKVDNFDLEVIVRQWYKLFEKCCSH